MSQTKRRFLKWLVGLIVILWAGVAFYGYRQTDASSQSSGLTTVTVGYQKGDPVDISRQRGELVKEMKAKGYKVVYKQFQDGTSLLQALKSGSIDYARTGDTPPVTAQVAGTKLTYIGAGSAKPNGSGIVVKKGSGISSIKDLKGKKVAYTKGTSSQYLLLQALKKAGMSASDVTWVNMDQSSASVAFAKGKVAAWVTWDPYTAQAQVNQNAKLLTSGVGLSNNRDFLISTQSYAKTHTKTSKYLVKYLGEDMQWANTHKSKLIKMMSKSLKLSSAVVKKMVMRRSYTFGSMTKNITKEQQKIADAFYQAGILKTDVTVDKIVTYLKE